MEKEICVLFDMDGVMIDTESQYDIVWKHIGDKYDVGIPNFERVIKGTTLPNIMKKYFSEHTDEERRNIEQMIDDFETKMTFPEIQGSLKFVDELKANDVKVGLVTSSTQTKLNGVNRVHHFDKLFDTIVSAERVVQGKPNPECYLLAAKDLGVDPQHCVVFEDSFAGLEAGKAAGMKIIGLATTHPAEKLMPYTDTIIPNFGNFGLSDLEAVI